MRPSIKTLVALNLSLAAASAACDDIAADDLAGQPDEPVSFRCDDPPQCLSNSPYVGDYQFSNIRTQKDTVAPEPDVSSSGHSRWDYGMLQLTDTWVSFDYLFPTAEGRLIARDSAADAEYFVDEALQAFFMVRIYQPGPGAQIQEIPMWLKFDGVSPSPAASTFDVWTYTIAAMTDQPTIDYLEEEPSPLPPWPPFGGPSPWIGTYRSICPTSPAAGESGKALVLKHAVLKFDGTAAWLEDGAGNGTLDLKTPSTSVIACQGHAVAKPQEFLAVTPNSNAHPSEPGERSYGLAGYNAAINAYRAFYDGASRTQLGAAVRFKDLAHATPWFDQTTDLPSAPIIGDWEPVLESVYKDEDPFGANCYYTDSRFPQGVHRRYDPPGGNPNLPGWNTMSSCGATQSTWANFGPVGAFVIKHIIPGGSSSS
ncbi:hypothetical protein [Nannocystis pusilla]|uniref:Uncharacterized protein n=1 Tax=Nannocystis pusilla TaxID=889268 RepID=A0ABS7TMW7_9BACT|nr:hypothetical protein [Nannocystis pusilla]MBZ5709550.1 hypothetical protein [Nannocystis pusilla]